MLSFTFRYAPVWRRAMALTIDIAILLLIDFVLLQPFIDFLGLRQTAHAATHAPLSVSIVRVYGLWVVVAVVVAWLYFALQESSRSQATVGKRFMGLIVFRNDEARLSFRRASYRFLAKLFSLATLTVGFFLAIWDKRHRTLHDRITRTIVVTERPLEFVE